MEDDQTTCRPVPAPRRLYPELRKSEYENVKVELINKNLNINAENIQNNANNSEKVPNNKVFLLYPTLPEELDNRNVNATATQKSILTETNDLYGPNANENVPIYSTPQPAPRPRKPQNTDIQNYENTIITPLAQVTPNDNLLPLTSNTVESSTGAVSRDLGHASKVLRKAPELPPKTSIHNVSITNETKDTNFKRDRLNKSYASYKSSSSSLAESIESSENSKYKSPSPGYLQHVDIVDVEVLQNDSLLDDDDDDDDHVDGQYHITTPSSDNDLLKTLGTTSKLLTESIGERMSIRAKGAKHKLDKNFKQSSEMLTNIGSETTQRLKKLGANFTLTKNRNKENMATAQFNVDRPQTLPPNDQVFQGIQFTSPLGSKAKGTYDLTSQELDNSYEVPKSIKITAINEELGEPPSYEDVLKTESSEKSTKKINPLALEAANRVLLKQQQQQQQQQQQEQNKSTESSERNSIASLDLHSPSPPMPTIPAPTLPQEYAENSEPSYGKINMIQPPARQKRRKNYEEIQLRRAPPPNPCPTVQDNAHDTNLQHLRMNVDSTELHELNKAAVLKER
ncbi:hypothetical protein DOY81_010466, partial [Sarcophaga bullata]